MSRKSIIAAVLFLASLAGCASEMPVAATQKAMAMKKETGNFILYVGNRTTGESMVNIKITIDGMPVVAGQFKPGGKGEWKEYRLQLDPGVHKVEITSWEGGPSYLEVIRVMDQPMAIVEYWYNDDRTNGNSDVPGHFTFWCSENPIPRKI